MVVECTAIAERRNPWPIAFGARAARWGNALLATSNPIWSLRTMGTIPSLRGMMRQEDVLTARFPATNGGPAGGISASERLLADIIDTVREPLLVLDAEFRVTRTNRAFFRTF